MGYRCGQDRLAGVWPSSDLFTHPGFTIVSMACLSLVRRRSLGSQLIGGETVLAYHGAETPYALDTTASWLPSDATDKALTAAMSQYWLNFAADGDPNGDGLPDWPRYNSENKRHQELGNEIIPGDDLEPGICDILDRHRQEKMAAFR